MRQKSLWIIAAILIVICGFCLFTCRTHSEPAGFNPTDDNSEFITLTDAVPDAILEIRYFGTYNFVGARIDGYLEPTA
jgi:D-alanyl-D-alanine dipeptidase